MPNFFILFLVIFCGVIALAFIAAAFLTIFKFKKNIRINSKAAFHVQKTNKPLVKQTRLDPNRFRNPNKPVVFNNWTIDFLKAIEWKRYEAICMEYLRIKNCDANVTNIGSDGGVDIRVFDKNNNLIAIAQCKAFNRPIGVSLIRELFGVMASDQVKLGVFLTTSKFTNDALEFGKKHPSLLLIDGDEFVRLVNNLSDSDKQRIQSVATDGDYTTPTCANCDVKMVKKIAKSGHNAGKEFWGCVNFPRCRSIINIRNKNDPVAQIHSA